MKGDPMRPMILLLALPALVAAAPDAKPTCPAIRAPLAPPLAGWNKAPQGRHVTVRANLPLGKRVEAKLVDVAKIKYLVAPEKSAAPGTMGSLLAFRVTRPGSYRVALGTAAWLDVVKDGKLVAATAHGHGQACSGIRKMVDFALTPGTYALQISGSSEASTAVMVTPLP